MSFLDGGGPLAFAHRGGAGEAPENTMRAFARAVDLGYRYLETDLRATADGVCLLFHDARLDRVTDGRGYVRERPWREVRRLRVHGSEPVPRLDELLAAFPDVRVNVDVKESGAIPALVDVLGRTGAHARVCVTSFSGARLAAVRRGLGPAVATALAPAEVLRLWRASRRSGAQPAPGAGGPRRTTPPGAVAAQVPERVAGRLLVDAAFVTTAHAAGLQVHVWTVDEEAAMDRLLDLGADGLMTDRPTVLREVLARRGAWPGPDSGGD